MARTVDMRDVAASLLCDGDTFDMGDGRMLRLSITDDEGYDIRDDGDWFGMLAPVERCRWGDWSRPRPAGFTGAARIIDTRDGRYWWQPPADVVELDTLRRSLLDAMEYGYCVVSVELCSGADVYGRPIPVAVESVGGVVWGDGADVVADLVAELLSRPVGAL